MPAGVGNAPGAANTALGGRRGPGFADTQDAFADDIMNRRETTELVRAYYRITDAATRKAMLDLLKKMTADGGE
jgi:hypothetical protein